MNFTRPPVKNPLAYFPFVIVNIQQIHDYFSEDETHF